MSEGRPGRKSDVKDASAKGGFFKANPPKREQKNADENDAEEIDPAAQSDSPLGNEDAPETPDNNEDEVKDGGDNESGEPPAKRRRRRKRRILLTDTAVKAKKRAEKRLQKEANPSTDNEKKEGAESPAKKEKAVVAELVVEKPIPAKYTPAQLLYDYILRKLISKDPEEFFAHPVQPSMAPDYLMIIEQPMDFQSIRQRIDANEYENIDQFRRDVNLIWENAMTYNQSNTIYYTAAHKLSLLAKYYLSEQYLQYLHYTLPFGRQLNAAGIGDKRPAGGARRKVTTAGNDAKRSEKFVSDNQKAADIIKAVEEKLKSRLTDRVPACGIGYLDNKDGALALNILVDAGGAGESGEKRRLTLGDIVPPLESGNPGMLTVAEPRLCHDYTVSYTEPGPFASFAPQFDTTWATMNKYDSELLTACYGDRTNAADALALRQMVADCGDADNDESAEFVRHVDALLDSLTDGEHSRTIKALSERPPKDIATKPLSRSTLRKMLDNVKSLQNLGLDLGYINELATEVGLNSDPSPPVDPLHATGVMLHDLATLNYQRLSSAPPLMLTDAAPPSVVETQLAQRVAGALTANIQAVGAKPADVVSAQAVHKSLGLAGDDDDYDYDLLREFMCVDDLGINAS